MPYIAQDDRDALDAQIEALADAIAMTSSAKPGEAAFAGLLNYSISTLAMKVAQKRFGKMRYWIVALLTGVFKNVSDEFYRRIGVPYEDEQIAKAGDIEVYKP